MYSKNNLVKSSISYCHSVPTSKVTAEYCFCFGRWRPALTGSA